MRGREKECHGIVSICYEDKYGFASMDYQDDCGIFGMGYDLVLVAGHTVTVESRDRASMVILCISRHIRPDRYIITVIIHRPAHIHCLPCQDLCRNVVLVSGCL